MTRRKKFEYDAAGRLLKIKNDSGTVLETYTYGASRNRLKVETATQKTYYAWGGSSPIVEYTEATASSTPAYSKSYVYAGSRLVSTATKASSTTETTEYHHRDRLGTRLVTNHGSSTNYQQSRLPFGTALGAESTAYSNQVFTSYDRSAATGLDYAVNRTYSQGQSRFTQVDPIGMAASIISIPQSLNLYSYTQNMPADFVDPTGLNLAGPGTRYYGMLDPMGVAYYVDGMLSDARTAWSIIGARAGYIDFENVAGVDVGESWYFLGDTAIRNQHIFISGNWADFGYENGSDIYDEEERQFVTCEGRANQDLQRDVGRANRDLFKI